MLGREVMDRVEATTDLTEWETARYEKTGNIRWRSILHFYTIDAIKAGYMRKNKGIWYITDEGEKALKLGEVGMLKASRDEYRKWKKEQDEETGDANGVAATEEVIDMAESTPLAIIEKQEGEAITAIRDFILAMDEYVFQEMIAALLEGMGYHISEISPRGPDGGIDIVAYTDPLGTMQPRIIVQVKHRPESAVSSGDIQRLSGSMKRPSDVGIFATSDTFSKPARKESRDSGKHIELMDFARIIELWQEYYGKLKDEHKQMLPLRPIYFLAAEG